MRVAMLTSWEEPCGIADYAAALVDALQVFVDVHIVPLKAGQTRGDYFRMLARACNNADLAHIQHEYIYFNGRHPWTYCWPGFLRALSVPYVVTAHTLLSPFHGGPLWKRAGRAVRESVYQMAGWTRYLSAGQFESARRVLVHTEQHKAELVRRGLAPEKISVLAQGVPERLPPGDGVLAARRWGLRGTVATIFGFLNPSKGHLLALEAWKRMAPPDATLVIAGKPFGAADAPYARQVQHAAASFPASVRLTGYLDEQELADLLAATDVALLPYLNTTSSYALSLALASGRAVLASDLAPFAEIQAGQPCLELFRTGDAGDLAARLGALLADAGRRERLAGAALVWAREHSWARVAERTADIYLKALAGK